MKTLYMEAKEQQAARERAAKAAEERARLRAIADHIARKHAEAEAARRALLMNACESISGPMRRPSILDRIAAWIFPAW